MIDHQSGFSGPTPTQLAEIGCEPAFLAQLLIKIAKQRDEGQKLPLRFAVITAFCEIKGWGPGNAQPLPEERTEILAYLLRLQALELLKRGGFLKSWALKGGYESYVQQPLLIATCNAVLRADDNKVFFDPEEFSKIADAMRRELLK